jgi:hypothetical protein
MTGSSNEFVVRPFGFVVDFQGVNTRDRAAGLPAANYANRGGATANSCASIHSNVCGDSAASDSVFVYAGENFTTLVAAVGWQAEDDQNSDGQQTLLLMGEMH